MEIRQLRYFMAVAEHLHFRRASEAIHIAQPALSQQIQQLEEQIGTRLFDRTQRKVELTPAGRLFYQKTKTLLRDMDRAVEDTRRIALGHAGVLDIAFITTAALDVMPAIFKRFREQNPNIEIRGQECSPQEQFRALYERTVEIAFVIVKLDDPVFASMPLQQYQLIAAVPSTHRLATAKRVSLHDLAPETLIVPEKHLFTSLHSMIQSAFQMEGLEPSREFHIRLLLTSLALVSAEMGISIIPDAFACFQTPGVTFIPIDPPLPPISIVAVWRKEGVSPLLSRFLDVLHEYAQSHTDSCDDSLSLDCR